ncbi:hypothetical protein LTR28_002002, partial [Elasticomyces elasticus]
MAGGITYDNGKTYTVASGAQYTVHCHSDNSARAYIAYQVASGGFNACFSACDASAGCDGYTYVGSDSGTCYLKSAEGTYSVAGDNIVSAFKLSSGGASASSVSSVSTTSSAVPVASSAAGSCSSLAAQGSTYTDANGKTYNVKCGADLSGYDIGAQGSSSYAGCFASCDNFPGCVSFAYVGGSGPGTCYLKGGVGNSNANSNVDAAYLSSYTATSTALSTTTTTASSTPVASPTNTGACSALPSAYTDEQNKSYTVACGMDFGGNDIAAVGSARFSGCFSLCDTTPGCVAFSYLGGSGAGTCYLKGSYGTGSANPNVDSAYTARPASVSSSSPPPSSTATTLSTP